jgi:membrane-associated phospholipid phosphatase
MWKALSDIGDAALTLPVATVSALWLRLSDANLAIRWIFLLAAGMATVGATKILYAGCGISIPAIDFRVISGHTMLSTAVWTVTFALLCQCTGFNTLKSIMPGLLIGAVTAMARVSDQAHTISEAIAGWTIGAIIATLFVKALVSTRPKLFCPIAGAIVLCLVTTVAYGHHAPIQHLIDVWSPELCSFGWFHTS